MREVIINKSFLSANYEEAFSYLRRCFVLLKDLEDEYPNFREWYFKVVCELFQGRRTIVLCEYNNEIIAISILKHTKWQKKICTFRIIPKYVRLTLGTQLMKDSLIILKDNNPLITVPEKRIQEFAPFLGKFHFEFVHAENSLYICDQKEFIYNSFIDEKMHFSYYIL